MKCTDRINIPKWKDLVYYDETSPTGLRWKVNIQTGRYLHVNVAKVNDVAGTTNTYSYSAISYNNVLYKCHRVIWILFYGEISDTMYVDHINGDRYDNTIANLRLVTPRVNQQNQKRSSRNSSGVTGVTFQNGKSWVASWFTDDGIKARKSFSINKYGYEAAFKLACEYRIKMIEELNRQGSSYTSRHGTDKGGIK